MYAKLIHSYKIVPASGTCLRHEGMVTVYPTHEDYLRAGYYPVEGLDHAPEDATYLFTLKDGKILATRRKEANV